MTVGQDKSAWAQDRHTDSPAANQRPEALMTRKGKTPVLRAYKSLNGCPCQDKGVSPAACGCATRRASLTFRGLLVGGKANLS